MKVSNKILFFNVVLALFLFNMIKCNPINKDEKEYYISEIEKKIDIYNKIDGYNPSELTYEERLSKIYDITQNEYAGDFELKPRFGKCADQIYLANNEYGLRIVMDYTPINQPVEMDFVYKEDGNFITKNQKCNSGKNVLKVQYTFDGNVNDTLSFFITYREASFGKGYINNLKPKK